MFYGRGEAGFCGVDTGVVALVHAAGTGFLAWALEVEVVWRRERLLYGRSVGLERGSRFVVAAS